MRLLPIGLACAVCASTAALGAQGDALTVQGSRVNVRANPNTGAPVLLQLERGQRVIEVGRHEAWVNVEVPNFAGREGWVHRSLLAPEAAAPPPERQTTAAAGAAVGGPQQPPPQPQAGPAPAAHGSRPMVEVQADGVNVRQGPTTNAAVIAKFNSGERLPALGERGNWVQVDLGGGRTGWIHDSLLAQAAGPGGAPSGPQTAAGTEAAGAPQRQAAVPPGGAPEASSGPEDEEEVAGAGGPAAGAAAEEPEEQVRVLATTVSLRREPSRLAPVVARLQQGDAVSVVGREGDWVEVAVDGGAGGARGWVHGSLVGPPEAGGGATAAAGETTPPAGPEDVAGAAPPTPPTTAADGQAGQRQRPQQQQAETQPPPQQQPGAQAAEADRVEITGRVVNVRRGPSTDAAVVAQVNQGHQLAELGREGDWVRVALDDGDGREGWVYGPLVRPAPPAVARVERGGVAQRTQAPRPADGGPPSPPAAAAPPSPPAAAAPPRPADGAPPAAAASPALPPVPPADARPSTGPSPAEKAPEGSRMTTAALAPGDDAELDAEERFDRFKTTVESLNERVRRAAGVDVFANVEDLGDGTVELTATRAWLAAPEAARRANLDTLFRLWDSVHAPDDAITVRIVDDGGDVAMEKRR